MDNDHEKKPIDLRNSPAASPSGKPIADTKVPANDKAKAKPGTTGVLRDLRDN